MVTECKTEKARRDYILLRRALDNNDQQAYAELMALYRDSIYFMMMKLVKNSDDAEDLTLMTFGKAFRYLDKYSPQYAFSTWLFRIAVNNSIDFLRIKNNNLQYVEDDVSDNFFAYSDALQADLPPTPEDEVIVKQRIQLMRNAVAQLPDKYRKVIELRYYEDLAYEDIAQRLNLTLSNVKIQILRAKQMLAELIKPIKNAM